MTYNQKRAVCAMFYLIAIFVGMFALYYIMTYYGRDSLLFSVAGIALLTGALIFVIVNTVASKRLNKKFSDENAAEIIKMAKSMREEALQDYLATEKAVIKSKNLLILFKILLSLYFACMFLVASFGASAGNPLRIPSIIVATVGILVYPLPLSDFFLGMNNARAPSACLERSQFPLLFAVVDEARKALNCASPYKITPVIGSGISVSAYSGGFYVSLDVEETAILTRDELYQIMLHEIAHVINSDIKRTWQLERFASQFDTRLGSIVTGLFFTRAYVDFMLKKEAYYMFCNLFYEQNADKAVTEYGNGQIYINGTAKAMTLSMYNDEFNPEMGFNIHQSERLPKDYLFADLKVFESFTEKYGEKWDYLLTHRIQSRSDSHPTFAMRMEFMGVNSYDRCQKETDDKYFAEQNKLLRWGCDYLSQNTGDDFRRARETYYLPTLGKVEKYRNAVAAGDKLSVMEKTEYIETFYNVDRDECLKLCNDVLTEYPRNAYANFYKGYILAQNLDKGCVDCLYVAAAENMNFADSAYDAIGMFACNVGDRELLDSYRARIEDDVLDTIRRKKEASEIEEDDIRANALPKEDYDAVLSFILDNGKGIISKVYSVSRGEGQDMRTFYYIELLKSAKLQARSVFFNAVFEFLDMYVSADGEEPNFSLWDESCDKNMKRLIKTTPDSLVYSHEEIR